jgi:hypothetical protein
MGAAAMSFSIEINSKAHIEVVCSKDSALQMTPEMYQYYLEDVNDTSRLCYKAGLGYEDTTRFVMRKVLPFKAAQRIIDQQLSATSKDSEMETRFSLKYILEEVRAALVDIKNPPNAHHPLEYKRASDGYCSEELVAGIYAAKVLGELHTGWDNSVKGSGDQALAQKK